MRVTDRVEDGVGYSIASGGGRGCPVVPAVFRWPCRRGRLPTAELTSYGGAGHAWPLPGQGPRLTEIRDPMGALTVGAGWPSGSLS
jgi:hypothetical protein